MQRTILTAAATALIAGSATAEGISYTRLSYDYQAYTGDFEDPTVGFFQGAVDYELNDFVLGASLDNTSGSNDSADGDFQDINIWGAYVVTPEILGGAGFLQRSGDTDESTDFELFGQYVGSSFGVAANHILLEDDESATALFAEYNVNETIAVGAILISNSASDGTAYLLSADYDAGVVDARAFVTGDTDEDGNVFGVRGHYEFGGAFRVGGAFEALSGADFDDRTMQVGAGYSFTDGLWLDGSVGQIDLDGGATVDFLRLLVTYETGDRARFDSTMAQRVSDDRWSGSAPLFLFAAAP